MKILLIYAAAIFAVGSVSALDLIDENEMRNVLGHGCWREKRESGSECTGDENFSPYDGCHYDQAGGSTTVTFNKDGPGVEYTVPAGTCHPGTTGVFAKKQSAKKHDECVNEGGNKDSCDVESALDCVKFTTFRCKPSAVPFTCNEVHIGGPFWSGTRNKAKAE